jgi:hypothetical protein
VLRFDGNTGAHVDTFAPRQSGVLFGPHYNRHVLKASGPVVASRFVLTGPTGVRAGARFALTVTAEDAAGKVATGYLDPGRVNGMAREVSLSGFSPVARLKIRP